MDSSTRLPWSLRILRQLNFPRQLGICERLFAKRLARAGICWVETSAGLPWKLDLRNATHRWIVYGKYEGAPFLDWARGYLPRDGIVVDSGANIGQMLLYLAQWVPRGKVLAFEPGGHQADWLEECLLVNRHLPVELLRVGLGEKPREAFLRDCGPPDRHGSWNQVSETEGERMQIVPLSDILSERQIKQVNLWKLDVEGFELPALRGAVEWLETGRIKALYVELRGENGHAIRRFLANLGYTCEVFAPSGELCVPDPFPDDTNGLFLSPR